MKSITFTIVINQLSDRRTEIFLILFFRLFRSEGKLPERPGFEALKHYRMKRVEHYTSHGILPGNGENWWRIRSKAQPVFLKPKNIENYLPILGQISDEFIDRIRLIRQENNEMKPDSINEMYRWALECMF